MGAFYYACKSRKTAGMSNQHHGIGIVWSPVVRGHTVMINCRRAGSSLISEAAHQNWIFGPEIENIRHSIMKQELCDKK